MRDELIDLHAIFESLGRLPHPALHRLRLRPTIERRVQLDGLEVLHVLREPFVRRQILVNVIPPMPVKPAGTADVQLLLALHPKNISSNTSTTLMAIR